LRKQKIKKEKWGGILILAAKERDGKANQVSQSTRKPNKKVVKSRGGTQGEGGKKTKKTSGKRLKRRLRTAACNPMAKRDTMQKGEKYLKALPNKKCKREKKWAPPWKWVFSQRGKGGHVVHHKKLRREK